MLLAEKKKAENISEYIIYMYQTELLLRNFDLDIEKVKVHVIGNIPDEKVNKAELTAWYLEVIEAMKSEELEKEGHLESVQQKVNELSDLHLELITSNSDYQQVFHAARPSIREGLQAAQGLISNPIQVCINGVFGLLLARMNGKEVEEGQMGAIEHFGNVLSYLNYHYKQSR